MQCFSEPNSIILDFAVWYCDLNIWSWRLLSISKCSFCVCLFLSPSLNLLLHLSCLHIYFYCSQVFHLRLWSHITLYMEVKAHFEKLFVPFDWCKCKMKQNITEPIRPSSAVWFYNQLNIHPVTPPEIISLASVHVRHSWKYRAHLQIRYSPPTGVAQIHFCTTQSNSTKRQFKRIQNV